MHSVYHTIVLTHYNDVEFKSFLQGFLPNLFLNRVKPHVTVETSREVPPTRRLSQNLSHHLKEIGKCYRGVV